MAEFLEFPLAYHLTFGTYGTRLHGDKRGTVSREQNRFGEPIIGQDVVWQRLEQSQLKFPPVVFSNEQQRHIEHVMAGVCERGGWEYHIAAGQPDHVHVMLTSPNDGKAIRKWLKTWLGQEMSTRWPLAPRQTWWAEGRSIRSVWNDDYFKNLFEYIRAQQTPPLKPQ